MLSIAGEGAGVVGVAGIARVVGDVVAPVVGCITETGGVGLVALVVLGGAAV